MGDPRTPSPEEFGGRTRIGPRAPVERPHPGTAAELQEGRKRGKRPGKPNGINGTLADQLRGVHIDPALEPVPGAETAASTIAETRHPFGIIEEGGMEKSSASLAPERADPAAAPETAARKELDPAEAETLRREVSAFGGRRSFESYVRRLNKVAGVEAQLRKVDTLKRREGLEKRLQAERFDAIRSLESKVQEILDTQLPGKYQTPVELLDPETDKPTEEQTSKKKQRISEFLRAGTKINLDPNKDYLQREAYATALHRRNELQYRLSGGDNTVQKDLAKWKTLLAKMDVAIGIRENPLKLSVFKIPSNFSLRPSKEARRETPSKRGDTKSEKREEDKEIKSPKDSGKGRGALPRRPGSSLDDDEQEYKLKNMPKRETPTVGNPEEGGETEETSSAANAGKAEDTKWKQSWPQYEPPPDLPTVEAAEPAAGAAGEVPPPEPPTSEAAPLPPDEGKKGVEGKPAPPEAPPFPREPESRLRRWLKDTFRGGGAESVLPFVGDRAKYGLYVEGGGLNPVARVKLFLDNKLWSYYNDKVVERQPELDAKSAEIAALEKKITGFDERVKNVERLRGGSFAGRDLSRIGAERDEYNTRLLKLRNERDRIQSKMESIIAHRSAWESKRNRIATEAMGSIGRELAPYETRMSELQAEKAQFDLEIGNFREQRKAFEERLGGLRKELEGVDFDFERDEINELVYQCEENIAAMDRHIEERLDWRASHEVKLARITDKARFWQDMQAGYARVTQRTGVEVAAPPARSGETYYGRGPEVRPTDRRVPAETPRETGAREEVPVEEPAEVEEITAKETTAAEKDWRRLTPRDYLTTFLNYYRSNFPVTEADFRRANPDLPLNREAHIDELNMGMRYTAERLEAEGRRVPRDLESLLQQMEEILRPTERK